jgi:hypothetical protein
MIRYDMAARCGEVRLPRYRLSTSRPPRLGRPAGVAARPAAPDLDRVVTRQVLGGYEEDGSRVNPAVAASTSAVRRPRAGQLESGDRSAALLNLESYLVRRYGLLDEL